MAIRMPKEFIEEQDLSYIAKFTVWPYSDSMNVKDIEFKGILEKYRKITIFGLSPDGSKPSQRVPLFMKSKGYECVGVYPGQKEIAGFPIFATLHEVPQEYRKLVSVFRHNDNIPSVVDDVMSAGGVEVLWLQLGITHSEAEKRAEAAGIRVVSNRCLHIEFEKYFR